MFMAAAAALRTTAAAAVAAAAAATSADLPLMLVDVAVLSDTADVAEVGRKFQSCSPAMSVCV